MKHSKKCPQYHLIGYVRLKNGSITEEVITINGPEVWTRPGWMMNWWWIDSCRAVFRCFTCLLTCISENFWKILRILFFQKSYNPTVVHTQKDKVGRSTYWNYLRKYNKCTVGTKQNARPHWLYNNMNETFHWNQHHHLHLTHSLHDI